MTEVKMKTVVIGWSEVALHKTQLEVPEEMGDQEILDLFYELDLSQSEPVDYTSFQIDYIENK